MRVEKAKRLQEKVTELAGQETKRPKLEAVRDLKEKGKEVAETPEKEALLPEGVGGEVETVVWCACEPLCLCCFNSVLSELRFAPYSAARAWCGGSSW